MPSSVSPASRGIAHVKRAEQCHRVLTAVNALNDSVFPISLDDCRLLVPSFASLPAKPHALIEKLWAKGKAVERKRLAGILTKLCAKYDAAAAAAGVPARVVPPAIPSPAAPLAAPPTSAALKIQLKRRVAQLKKLKAAGKVKAAAKCTSIAKQLMRQIKAADRGSSSSSSSSSSSTGAAAAPARTVKIRGGRALTVNDGTMKLAVRALVGGGGFLVEGPIRSAELAARLRVDPTATSEGDAAKMLIASRTVAKLHRAARAGVQKKYEAEHAKIEAALGADKNQLLLSLNALKETSHTQLAESAEVHRDALEEAGRRMQQRELNYAASLMHSEVSAVLEAAVLQVEVRYAAEGWRSALIRLSELEHAHSSESRIPANRRRRKQGQKKKSASPSRRSPTSSSYPLRTTNLSPTYELMHSSKANQNKVLLRYDLDTALALKDTMASAKKATKTPSRKMKQKQKQKQKGAQVQRSPTYTAQEREGRIAAALHDTMRATGGK